MKLGRGIAILSLRLVAFERLHIFGGLLGLLRLLRSYLRLNPFLQFLRAIMPGGNLAFRHLLLKNGEALEGGRVSYSRDAPISISLDLILCQATAEDVACPEFELSPRISLLG